MSSVCISVLFPFIFLLCISICAKSNTNVTMEKPLKIGVPAATFSSIFVQLKSEPAIHYTGFSIEVFHEAWKLMDYKIDYNFVDFNGSYDDLLACVANKTFDGAVADITLLERRWGLVEFTVPYTESGLAMVVPVMRAQPWVFLKPFSPQLWIATLAILVYTMCTVWFLEHRYNGDFGGSWNDQLGNAVWFAFTSLFFAHREKVQNNHTRVVVVVWLFLVLIITQSFTASLSSWLIVRRLNPNIDVLRNTDAKVGCNPMIKGFIENDLGYKSENIKFMEYDNDYLNGLRAGTISAVFVEIPYAKLLVNGRCKDFTMAGSSYRFGGLSFAFQKGSAIASHLSKAILKLSENGILNRLEASWITPSSDCKIDSQAGQNTDSLTFESFWDLYLLSITITTTSVLWFIARLLKNYRRQLRAEIIGMPDNKDGSTWKEIIRVLWYLTNAELKGRGNAQNLSKVAPNNQML